VIGMSESSKSSPGSIVRREFLRRGVAAGGLALGLPSLAAADPAPPRVQAKRTLGRTGLEIADVSFGGSRLDGDEDVVRYALERGINYFDTAEMYQSGESEKTLGRALSGVRDQIVLTSKVKAGATESKKSMMVRLEASLQRLQTDRVDIYMNHALNDVDRLRNADWGEFTERAIEQGKIRFRGMSGHAGHLIECLDYALDHDLADVILVAHNFGQDPRFHERFTRGSSLPATHPDLPRVLAKAKKTNVGVVAMKTLMGARKNDMRPYEVGGASFAQAALRWTLSSPNVDALVITMRNRAEVDEYLGASGWKGAPPQADVGLLSRYFAANASYQCRYGCSECADSCPSGVAISEVLRTRMYARDYGDLELARADYAALGEGAGACLSCSVRSCAGACPYGLELDAWTEDTHRWLAAGVSRGPETST
jgi:predicted aldo/keto reductase-like oxidoreductase